MGRILIVFALAWITTVGSATAGSSGTLSLDKEREKALKEFDVSEIPNPDTVRKTADAIFGKKLDAQSEKELRQIAKQANKLTNLIGAILSEYASYYRENYRYDFIQKKVMGPHDEYIRASNEFIGIRNQAYFNLGLKAKQAKMNLRAFFYFKDAFRLSSFDCEDGSPEVTCLRWQAEQEMKKLLSLTDIQSYVRWKAK